MFFLWNLYEIIFKMITGHLMESIENDVNSLYNSVNDKLIMSRVRLETNVYIYN